VEEWFMVGTISNVISVKRFGFIAGENGQEYFFHSSDLTSSWDELASDFAQTGGGKIKVTFTPEKTPKGPRARDVATYET
jgi:cold shock CspA family protein